MRHLVVFTLICWLLASCGMDIGLTRQDPEVGRDHCPFTVSPSVAVYRASELDQPMSRTLFLENTSDVDLVLETWFDDDNHDRFWLPETAPGVIRARTVTWIDVDWISRAATPEASGIHFGTEKCERWVTLDGLVECGGIDSDGDGVPDRCDRCPNEAGFHDSDGDAVPDVCDVCEGDDLVDTDGDSVPDDCDPCDGNRGLTDTDGDTIPDDCDACPAGDDRIDTDGDGTPDACDPCPDDPTCF